MRCFLPDIRLASELPEQEKLEDKLGGVPWGLPDDLWPVEADEGQLGQVVHNILLNAVQAMPDGGGISLRGVNLPPGTDPSLPPADAWVRVSLSDNGPGIPTELLSRIFDPFFTTKQKGTGLGLAISYTIMEKHKGFLRVESTPGTGTTFHLILPAAPGSPG